jgi:hypothetical protein
MELECKKKRKDRCLGELPTQNEGNPIASDLAPFGMGFSNGFSLRFFFYYSLFPEVVEN